jgi:hypothetical protein
MNKQLFFLGYNAADYLNNWFKKENYSGVDFYFIDNGKQNLPQPIKDMLYYTTTENIGCGGGWNLILDIAFNHLGLEKVLIGEEDAQFNQEMLDALWEHTTPDRLMTTYGNGFGFALFCVHKDTHSKIGDFDENYLYAASEDADYKVRCAKAGIEVFCMEVDPRLNGSATSFDPNSPRPAVEQHNKDYFKLKWGNAFEDNNEYYNEPFNSNPPFVFDPLFVEKYGERVVFPSKSEYINFINNKG